MTERDQPGRPETPQSGISRVWLTPAEVQQVTGAGRTEVYAALQTGDLEGHQRGKGRKWRVHRDAVERWITGSSAKRPA